MSASSSAAIRRYVLTGSVAAITATGAWYGAGLKTQREREQERQVISEAPPMDKIEQMELLRSQLLKRRGELQSKIDKLATKPTSPDLPSPKH